MTDFSINLVLNHSPSPPQQYTRSKDQDAAEDREEPCAGAAGGWKFVAFNRCVDDFNREINGEQKEFKSAFETTDAAHTLTNLPDGTYRLYEVYLFHDRHQP